MFAIGVGFLGGQPRMGVFVEAARTDGGLRASACAVTTGVFGIFNGGALHLSHTSFEAAVLKLGVQRASDRTKTRRAVLDS